MNQQLNAGINLADEFDNLIFFEGEKNGFWVEIVVDFVGQNVAEIFMA